MAWTRIGFSCAMEGIIGNWSFRTLNIDLCKLLKHYIPLLVFTPSFRRCPLGLFRRHGSSRTFGSKLAQSRPVTIFKSHSHVNSSVDFTFWTRRGHARTATRGLN